MAQYLQHLLTQDVQVLEVAVVVRAERQLVQDAGPKLQLEGVGVGQDLVAHLHRKAVVARVVLATGNPLLKGDRKQL